MCLFLIINSAHYQIQKFSREKGNSFMKSGIYQEKADYNLGLIAVISVCVL